MQQIAYITAANISEARTIAQQLVKKRLAACCNIIPEIVSIYEWKSSLQEDKEVLLLAKTTKERATELIDCVAKLHSYDCPCITILDLVDGHPAFFAWVNEQCQNHS